MVTEHLDGRLEQPDEDGADEQSHRAEEVRPPRTPTKMVAEWSSDSRSMRYARR
ncbi:hypothetical protein VB779_13035 [Haloarculaceae archaeon H-GB11]|nr:hypothetical protein [Haloarculaceae archaeon H-GB11]